MNVLGISPRTMLALVREARAGESFVAPLLVVGPLAAHLARSLAEGGDPSLVRTVGAPASASAFVCILGGAPKPEQLTMLRSATRAGVPTVAVQTGNVDAEVPYVLPGDIVLCRPGEGFPVDEIATALARGLGRDAAALAGRLPVLRAAAERDLALRAAGAAAGLPALARSAGARLPLLVPLQVRLLRDLRLAHGGRPPSSTQEQGLTLGQELGASLAAGLAARTLVRRVPLRNRIVEGLVAGGVTYSLAAAARRLR